MFCMQMKPTGKTDQRSREDYLEWRSVFVVVCGGLRWRWLGSLVAAATMLLLFPCKDTSPYVFSFSFFFVFFFCFHSLGSLLYLCASPLFFFFLLPCFFFLSLSVFSLFFFSSSPPFAVLLFCSLFPCIYRQKT